MSRPKASEPNQKSAEGARVRFAGARAVGSTVPSHGAKIATKAMTARMARPIAIVGWLTTKPHRPRRSFTGGRMSGKSGAAATRLFYQFPVFSSGIGIPDYVVFGPGFLREWDGDVRAAGWFDWAWRMK